MDQMLNCRPDPEPGDFFRVPRLRKLDALLHVKNGDLTDCSAAVGILI
jgi:hypothetical protein